MLTSEQADEIICYSELMHCPHGIAAECLGYHWSHDNYRIVFLRWLALKHQTRANEDAR
jgi:hypothetical protein